MLVLDSRPRNSQPRDTTSSRRAVGSSSTARASSTGRPARSTAPSIKSLSAWEAGCRIKGVLAAGADAMPPVQSQLWQSTSGRQAMGSTDQLQASSPLVNCASQK